MPAQIAEEVVAFYESLFNHLFSEPFARLIENPIRRREVLRRVQEASDAASQSLARLFLNESVTETITLSIIKALTRLERVLTPDDVATTTYSPDALLERFLPSVPAPKALASDADQTLYRVALHTVLQTLVLVGPVMAEWKSLGFAGTYELPRRVVNRLNEISDRFTGHSGRAQDDAYEETYRDYLVSRFHQTGIGTVKSTLQMAVDIRELFVMPMVAVVAHGPQEPQPEGEFMELTQAREFLFRSLQTPDQDGKAHLPALQQIRDKSRNVLIGLPGSGKSTFLEWLQVQLAFVQEELVMAGEQAIPVLLRVRELKPEQLPTVDELLRYALASSDRAALAPPKWLERQMRAGRVFFMLDGIDEIEPEHRDQHLLPWITALCREYRNCRFLISSRPVGYPPGALKDLGFTECRLLDFDKEQVAEYTKHWCTAVRLAQNVAEGEARREGAEEGAAILKSFETNPYVRDLARNPLMLSAICLVNYFEQGKLPEDRAILYGMCVDGLLHNWDERRGLRSEFALEQKLRVCRELAIRMQIENRAEYEAGKVCQVFEDVLRDEKRARRLLENIRYRTGLLIERRNGVYAFAHLTFQEYLAALAVARGNGLDIDRTKILAEHASGRWNEVIALYCGITDASEKRRTIAALIALPDAANLADLLTEAFFTSGEEITNDVALRKQVTYRVAVAPFAPFARDDQALARFNTNEAIMAANETVGRKGPLNSVSFAFRFLQGNPSKIRGASLESGLLVETPKSSVRLAELMYLVHRCGSNELLAKLAHERGLYSKDGPKFDESENYSSQAEIALMGLAEGLRLDEGAGTLAALNTTLDVLLEKPPTAPPAQPLEAVLTDPVARAKLIRVAERATIESPRIGDIWRRWLKELQPDGSKAEPPPKAKKKTTP